MSACRPRSRPGASLIRTQQVAIPINGDAGNLRFVVQTDSGNAISELVENNNVLLDSDNFAVPLALQLTLNATQIAEDAANPVVTGTLTRNGSRDRQPRGERVASSDTTEMTVPATVTIPASVASVNFNATVQQDGLYDGPQNVTITGSAAGFTSGADSLTVIDANIPRLTFSLSTNRITEGGAPLIATVTREPVNESNLVVQLSSLDSAQISVPATALILANQASTNFPVSAYRRSADRTNQQLLVHRRRGRLRLRECRRHCRGQRHSDGHHQPGIAQHQRRRGRECHQRNGDAQSGHGAAGGAPALQRQYRCRAGAGIGHHSGRARRA